MKTNLKKWKNQIIVFYLLNAFLLLFYLQIPLLAQVTCINGVVSCSNGGTPSCPSGTTPSCDCGSPGCINPRAPQNSSFFCNNGEIQCIGSSPATYTCNPGYTICPNSTDSNSVCCLNGCCPSDTTKCKCPSSNNCSPNCSQQPTSTPTATPSNGSMPCNAVQLIQTCNIINALPDYNKCECTFSSSSATPTPTPTFSSTPSCSKCISSNNCGVQNYCNLTTQCCTSNPVNCIFGCSTNSQCFTGMICSSNCCIDDPDSPSITLQLASQAKSKGFKILVKGEKITSLTKCTVKSYSDSFIMKARPEAFSLNKSSTQKLLSIITPQTFKIELKNNTKEIIISVRCDNGASSTKIVGLSN